MHVRHMSTSTAPDSLYVMTCKAGDTPKVILPILFPGWQGFPSWQQITRVCFAHLALTVVTDYVVCSLPSDIVVKSVIQPLLKNGVVCPQVYSPVFRFQVTLCPWWTWCLCSRKPSRMTLQSPAKWLVLQSGYGHALFVGMVSAS